MWFLVDRIRLIAFVFGVWVSQVSFHIITYRGIVSYHNISRVMAAQAATIKIPAEDIGGALVSYDRLTCESGILLYVNVDRVRVCWSAVSTELYRCQILLL